MMGIVMKSLAFLLCGILVIPALAAQSTGVAGVESVYLTPMGNSLDQFLASQLTRQKILRVVADPRKADAVFTDRLGMELQAFLDEIEPAEGKAVSGEKDAGGNDPANAESEQKRVTVTTFGRGKGTVFLVDRKTRTVLWSTYERPKNATPDQVNKAASRIAERLKGK